MDVIDNSYKANIRLISIQHKSVLEKLLNDERYIADWTRVATNQIEPNQYMRNFYGWDYCPVFGCPVGTGYASFGFKTNNAVVLELEVPEDIVKLQYFYDWTDVIYFMEFPDEFQEVFDTNIVPTIESFADRVLRFENQGSYNVFQATIPYIDPDWLVRYLNNKKDVQAYLNQVEEERIIISLDEFKRN